MPADHQRSIREGYGSLRLPELAAICVSMLANIICHA
jgi:hypothetical protein